MAASVANWAVISEVLRNFAIVGAAMVGVGLACWRATALNRQAAASAAQVAVSRRENAAEVFISAVGQPGSDRSQLDTAIVDETTRLPEDLC